MCVYPEDLDPVVKRIEKAFEYKTFKPFSHRIVLENDRTKTILLTGQVIPNAADEVIEIEGSCEDITVERLKEELSNQKKQQNISERVSKTGSGHWNISTDEFKCSENLYDVFEFELKVKVTIDLIKSRIHPDDKMFVKSIFQEVREGEEHGKFSHRLLFDDGRQKIVKVYLQAERDTNGDLTQIIGSIQDISDSKNKELEILSKNQSLSLAEEITNIGNWKWRMDTKKIEWSDNLYNLTGLDIGTPITLEKYLSLVPPEEHSAVWNYMLNSTQSKIITKNINTIICADGTYKIVETATKAIRDKAGKVIEILGATQDITNKKKQEIEFTKKTNHLNLVEGIAMIGYWSVNIETLEVNWSDNLYRMNEFEIGTPMNMELFQTALDSEEMKYITTLFFKYIKTKVFEKFTYTIKSRNGITKTLEVVGKIITNTKNEAVEFIGLTRDITNEIEAQNQIIEANKKLSISEKLAKIGHWNFNIKTGFFTWSENLYNIFDIELGTPITLEKLLSKVPLEEHKPLLQVQGKAVETKFFEKFTHSIQVNNGTNKTIEVIGKVITNDSNEVVEIIGTSRDVTAEIEKQNKIIETNNRLEKSTTELTFRNKQLADFNHISSHNLRSPVSNLNALLGHYKTETSAENKLEILNKFEIVVDHLTQTLNTLIEAVKVKSTHSEDRKKVLLDDILTKTKEILAGKILESGAQINSDFSINDVCYNQIYLESIFLNLISNAIRYRSLNKPLEIDITTTVVGETTTLAVKDNGLGIDLKKHGNKLFGLNKVFHRHPESQGVGLFLTKAHVEAMGGSIWAESEEGIGSTFYVTLN